ncbi:membrane protein [Aureimonas endophytica]|uniref:Membrane protein n=1 Tax=Aureimonas endophytica TaxID=2027858 RepID=A0A916ZDP1_9HYPH|nr:CbtA family protein [Aureimonas endophytica]GGD90762.1 membrane protein [Aureimonas endophytica]
MVRSLLWRGLLAGVLAGLCAFLFARVFGEPQIDYAIAFEAQRAAADAAAEPELVSRATQAGIGLLTGLLVYGAALGGLFALAFAVALGRLGGLGPRPIAAILAAIGFVAFVLVPQLKYPANPPAVGVEETIAARTQLFFAMLLISGAALAAGASLVSRLVLSIGRWNAVLAGIAVFLAIVGLAGIALPAINEVPEEFSATILWRFRIASLGLHAVLWAGLGLGFGALADHLLAPARRRPSPLGAR